MYCSFGEYFKGPCVVWEKVDVLINSGFNHINLPVKISRIVTRWIGTDYITSKLEQGRNKSIKEKINSKEGKPERKKT